MSSSVPAPAPTQRAVDLRAMLPYYAGGLAVLVAAIYVSIRWGTEYPIVQVMAAGVCAFVGKQLGMPFEKVYMYALQRKPEKALAVALQALQSLPPEAAEAATKELISSIPPAAIQRVILVNTTEAPPPPPPPLGRVE